MPEDYMKAASLGRVYRVDNRLGGGSVDAGALAVVRVVDVPIDRLALGLVEVG